MSEKKFHPLTVDELWRLVARHVFRRRITAVHVHHTWKPRQSDYRGESTIRGMWRFHVETNGWSDIAQHVSIAPDGVIWTGRPWDRPPASASGFNGNATAGPFMIETIGNFDVGEDRLEGAQRQALVETIAAVLARHQLQATDIRFHNEMSGKTCPGSGVDKETLVREVAEAMEGATERLEQALPTVLPFGPEAFAEEEILTALRRPEGAREILTDEGELAEEDEPLRERESYGLLAAAPAGDPRGLFDPKPKITTEELAFLAAHVVNLNQGRLSTKGTFSSSPGQIESIFQVHLRKEAQRAKAEDRPLRLLLYAHGGLVNERKALRQAADQVHWWMENGVYPIFFVWETGPLETLRQILLGDARFAAARGWFRDQAIEKVARHLGRPVWNGIKAAAANAVVPAAAGDPETDNGGALLLAKALGRFVKNGGLDGVPLELFALGHSAGSILHAHALPVLLDRLGTAGPPVRELFLLAPAITPSTFNRLLGPAVKSGRIQKVSLFTMQRAYEEADRTVLGYRGSLLLLISAVLEHETDTPVLGLQESLENDPQLRTFFGLSPGQASGELVLSPTARTTGPDASRATCHSGFDNDPATLHAVLERILGTIGRARFEAFAHADPDCRAKESERELAEEARASLFADMPWAGLGPGPGVLLPAVDPAGSRGGRMGRNDVTVESGGGRRRALTIGIDAYPDPEDRLSCCVADARAWAEAFRALGFEVTGVLTDQQATRSNILGSIEQLLRDAQAGDVVSIHYSGHGTQVPDRDGDETDARDEALCPVDFRQGALLVDDDLADLFEQLAPGVPCTVFLDSCNSGTSTRVAARGARSAPPSPGAKVRFVPASPQLVAAHHAFRQARGLERRRAVVDRPHRVVNFSACQAHELAWESDGQGEFTRRAIEILQTASGLTHDGFQRAVEARFAPLFRQRPYLDCALEARDGRLLAPLTTAGGGLPGLPGLPLPGPAGTGSGPEVAALLHALARLLER